MKTILMIALMWLAAPPTTQKQTIYKDGRNVGRVEIERDNIRVYDEQGRLKMRGKKQKGVIKLYDKNGKYIRQERYTGACSRSFYVGTNIQPEDISAKYEGGVLRLSVPKNVKKQLPEKTVIAIE